MVADLLDEGSLSTLSKDQKENISSVHYVRGSKTDTKSPSIPSVAAGTSNIE